MLVGDLAGAPATRRLTLRRLSETAVRALAEPTGVDAGELSRLTSGNPFLVVEALAAGGGLPATVRDATLARVGRLAPEARGVVDAASLVGPARRTGCARRDRAGSCRGDRGGPRLRGADGGRGCSWRFAMSSPVRPSRLRSRHHAARRFMSACWPCSRSIRLGATTRGWRTTQSGRGWLSRPVGTPRWLPPTPSVLGRCARRACSSSARCGSERALTRATASSCCSASRERRISRGEWRMRCAAAEEAAAIAERELGAHERGRALIVLVAALWSLDRVAEARAAARSAIDVLRTTNERADLARAHCAYLRVEAVAFDPSAVIAGRAARVRASRGRRRWRRRGSTARSVSPSRAGTRVSRVRERSWRERSRTPSRPASTSRRSERT